MVSSYENNSDFWKPSSFNKVGVWSHTELGLNIYSTIYWLYEFGPVTESFQPQFSYLYIVYKIFLKCK